MELLIKNYFSTRNAEDTDQIRMCINMNKSDAVVFSSSNYWSSGFNHRVYASTNNTENPFLITLVPTFFIRYLSLATPLSLLVLSSYPHYHSSTTNHLIPEKQDSGTPLKRQSNETHTSNVAFVNTNETRLFLFVSPLLIITLCR